MAHLQLGNVRRQQARLAEANEHYRQASSMRPDAPDVLIQWGVALAQQGRLAEALDRFTGALRLRPDSGAAHYNWGNAVLAAGDVEEAIAHYREAVRLEPQGAEAYNNWGRALAIQGKREEAIANYREALRIKPMSVPHYNWGNALFAAGDLDGAIAHYREAARLDPDAAEIYNNWGMALARQARWEEAMEAMTSSGGSVRAVRRSAGGPTIPSRPPTWIMRFRRLRKRGRLEAEGASRDQWWCRKGTLKIGMKPLTMSPAPSTARTSENQNIWREVERIATEALTIAICRSTSPNSK